MISVAGAFCRPKEAAVAASWRCWSIQLFQAQQLQRSRSVLECCRSVLLLQKRRLGALQERPRGQEAAVGVAGALQRP